MSKECGLCGGECRPLERAQLPVGIAVELHDIGVCDDCALRVYHTFRLREYCSALERERMEARQAANAERPRVGPVPAPLRLQVFKRDKYACVQCGSADELHADHVFPASKGGQNRLENLQTLCKTCNLRKGARVA